MTQELVKAHKVAADSRRFNLIDWFWLEHDPYDWQWNFSNAGSEFKIRHNASANRGGKSYWNTYEVACHSLLRYDNRWKGKRFTEATTFIIAGETTESVRDTIQMYLLGKPGDYGTGWIPKSRIINVVNRQGGSGAVDHIIVKNDLGTSSVIYLKSFDQGPEKIAGMEAHGFCYDENCPLKYWSEAITRTATKNGIVFGAYTALEYSDLVAHLEQMEQKDGKSVFITYVDITEAKHLTPETIKILMSSWAPWERQVRSTGRPNRFGSGLVYPVDEQTISVPPFHIPPEWKRLGSIDFGKSADPTALVFRAIDPSTDTTYIYKTWKSKSGDSPRTVVNSVYKEAAGIPIAWPHDGNKKMDSGITTVAEYRKSGLKMLPFHATTLEGSMTIADGIVSILQKMEKGKYKVFSTCREWFEEYRKYRYDENGIAKKQQDHIMDADRYGCVMERCAIPYNGMKFALADEVKTPTYDYEVFSV